MGKRMREYHPKEKNGKFSVTFMVPKELYFFLLERSRKESRSLSSLLVFILQNYKTVLEKKAN
jgi:hypothetical protein